MHLILIAALGLFAPRLDVPPGDDGGCKCDGAATPAAAFAPLLVGALALRRRRR